jgi:hypothetical protein
MSPPSHRQRATISRRLRSALRISRRLRSALPAWARARAIGLVLTVAGQAGCSFAFVEPPPVDHARRRFFDCSTVVAPPIVDSVLASLGVLSLAGAAGESEADAQRNGTTRAATVASAVVLLGAAGSAAIYGYRATAACRQARAALAARQGAPAP